ncbi:hypothetical protein E1B28_013761 [Marasmius oreades]|nr:uncharacterized protein E1B28_013761 [Marasmius oreades]KAG7087822.1 hypothetical protein E1B28_013761 [Marasmius oreades]
MDRIGRQVCEFLLQFIEKEKIPKASDDLRRGGIAVMGWFIGACSAMALFSDADLVPRRTHAILEQYVKDLVLTDPPYLCFGFKMPDIRYYDTWTDPDLKTPQEKVQKFSVWVSSFFDHPNPDSGDVRDMDLTAKQGGNATVAKWTSKEFERYFSEGAAVRSDFPMYTEPMQTTLRELTEQVFYDESLIKSHFPHLKVTVVYGTRTTWRSLWGSKELQRSYDERLSKGMKARPLRSYKISGANHFLHWEDPKLLLEKVAEGIRGPNGTHFRGT